MYTLNIRSDYLNEHTYRLQNIVNLLITAVLAILGYRSVSFSPTIVLLADGETTAVNTELNPVDRVVELVLVHHHLSEQTDQVRVSFCNTHSELI